MVDYDALMDAIKYMHDMPMDVREGHIIFSNDIFFVFKNGQWIEENGDILLEES